MSSRNLTLKPVTVKKMKIHPSMKTAARAYFRGGGDKCMGQGGGGSDTGYMQQWPDSF